MSEDRQSTESLPPPAEPSDAASNGSPPARPKSRQPALSKPPSIDKPDEGIPSEAVQSAPMTASNSSSSEVGPVPDPLAAGPYSTRSRGRNGASRPNYAEDIEMDFELTSPAPPVVVKMGSTIASAKRHVASSLSSSPATTTETEKGPAASTRKGHATTNGVHTSPAAKDMIPGTSSFSANAAANGTVSAVSRKRKQPHGGASVNGSAKRLSTTAENQSNFRLSNMMTFESSGARLMKNGKLKADDGTTLEVNGEFLSLPVLYLANGLWLIRKTMST